MTSKLGLNYVQSSRGKKYFPKNRAGASLGIDLAVGDREAGADSNKDSTGNVIEKVNETESKSKAESHFQAGMLKHFVSQWQQLFSNELVL